MRISIAILILILASCGETPPKPKPTSRGMALTSYTGTNRYVSADGSDQNSGGLSSPYRSIAKLNSVIAIGDSVFFRRGDSFHGTLNITKSGVIVGAYGEGAKPIITGLVSVSGWSSGSASGVMEAVFTSSSPLNIVLVNGEQKGVGRYPNLSAANKGWLALASHTGTTSINHADQSINWAGGELIIRRQHWIIDRNKITSHIGTKVSYTVNYSTRVSEPKNGYGYFFQNHVKALDQQGEWCYVNGKLSMYQPSGLVQAATQKNLLVINAGNVKINNIVFKGANDHNVVANGSGISISDCEILFSGHDGVRFYGNDFRLERSVIMNANNNGVESSGGARSVIRANLIRNTYHIAGMGGSGDGQGRAIGSTGYGLVERNSIINAGYVGIMLGDNYDVIQNNLVDSFCIVKDDGGGIYNFNGSLEAQSYKIIGNIVMNGIGAKEGTLSPNPSSKGIYLDSYCNNHLITDNFVANCAFGYLLHSAYDNTLRRNTAYNNSNSQLYVQNDTRTGMGRGNTIVDNMFIARVPTQYVFNMFTTFNDVNLIGRIDSNWYARPMDTFNIMKTYYNANGYFSLAQWKSVKPYDKNSKHFKITFPKTTNPDSIFRMEINKNDSPEIRPLPGTYVDVKGKEYVGSITLAPLQAAVLIRTKAGTPVDPPTTPPTGSSITIAAPINGAVYRAGDDIRFRVPVTQPFVRGEFYANGTKFWTENTIPYEFTWWNVLRGTYTIYGKGILSNGTSVTSPSITITVN